MAHSTNPTITRSPALHTELRNWIQSVIRQRSAIIRMGKSRADANLMKETIDYLNRHLDYYPFNDDRKMAGFFQRNQDKINRLLPGTGSTSYESRMEQFRNYLQITKTIHENENLSNWQVSKFRRDQAKIPALGR